MSAGFVYAPTCDGSERVDPADARWLRQLVLRVLRASAVLPVASVLSLSGCAAPADDFDDPALSVCPGGFPRLLAKGMTLTREVDYLADVGGGGTISERGVMCGAASDPDGCAAAVQSTAFDQRHLLTTEGDEVRVWLPDAAGSLLGTIDEVDEALWIAQALDYQVPCSARVADRDGYVIAGAKDADSQCLGSDADVKLRVESDGRIVVLETVTHRDNGCAVAGRRPPGRCSARPVRARSALGAYFARAAQLEAASVPAFAQIRAELCHHRAPASLIVAAERARRDEIRHARQTTRLARRFGVEPEAPRVEPVALRSLAALALDNAREGCVFETYAALEATHQALSARDPAIRASLRAIARDELRHAAFSHALHGWLRTQVSDQTNSEIVAARSEAATSLHASLLDKPSVPSLCALAGLPTQRVALALHAGLARSLWC